MSFNYKNVVANVISSQVLMLPDAKYGVGLSLAEVAPGVTYWKCVGVHHLLPEENHGKHNVYLVTVDENGQRVPCTRIGWTWNGRRPEETANPVILDKPDSEPHGNIALTFQQIVSCWVFGEPSDKVIGLSTRHADEPLPDGRLLNSVGHHSFLVIFQRVVAGASTPTQPQEPGQSGYLITTDQLNDIYCDIEKIGERLNSIMATLRGLQ